MNQEGYMRLSEAVGLGRSMIRWIAYNIHNKKFDGGCALGMGLAAMGRFKTVQEKLAKDPRFAVGLFLSQEIGHLWPWLKDTWEHCPCNCLKNYGEESPMYTRSSYREMIEHLFDHHVMPRLAFGQVKDDDMTLEQLQDYIRKHEPADDSERQDDPDGQRLLFPAYESVGEPEQGVCGLCWEDEAR
jgi:hypothetical protein